MLPPFRTTPRLADPAQLAAAAASHRGARFRPAEQQIAAFPKNAPSPATFDRLMMHPDERVQLAAIERSDWFHPKLPTGRARRAYLYHVAMCAASRNGEIWTPLLDRLARANAWPHAADLRECYAITGMLRHVPIAEQVPWRTLDDHVSELAPWVASHPEDEVRTLLAFDHPSLARVIGRNVRQPTDRFIADLLAHWRHAAPALAQNPTLTAAQSEGLLEWAFTDIACYQYLRTGEAFPFGQAGADTIRNLLLVNRLPHAVVDRCLAAAESGAREGLGGWARSILLDLLPIMTEADLLRFLPLADRKIGSLTHIIYTTRVDSDAVWGAILAAKDCPEVRAALCRHPRAPLAPSIRARLVAAATKENAKELVRVLDGDDARALFRRVMRDDQWHALGLILTCPNVLRFVVPADLMPALMHESEAVRERARHAFDRLDPAVHRATRAREAEARARKDRPRSAARGRTR